MAVDLVVTAAKGRANVQALDKVRVKAKVKSAQVQAAKDRNNPLRQRNNNP
ncbi:hypothetical protein D3C86_1850370 [compost metagenome]